MAYQEHPVLEFTTDKAAASAAFARGRVANSVAFYQTLEATLDKLVREGTHARKMILFVSVFGAPWAELGK